MWLRSGKMMFWSNALSAADLNMCSGNAMSLKKQEKGLPSPSCSPWLQLNSNKAAQQPLFPCSQAQGATAEAPLHWGPPHCSPPGQGHAPATLNNCYSTGRNPARRKPLWFLEMFAPEQQREQATQRQQLW